MTPQTALEAIAWRRPPVSGWPWRSPEYLPATLHAALVAAGLLAELTEVAASRARLADALGLERVEVPCADSSSGRRP